VTAPIRKLPALPAPTSVANVIRRYLLVLGSQVGYREGQSGGHWNNDQAFGVWYGYPKVAWCHQFVSWGASVAGLLSTVIPKEMYTPSGENWFEARKRHTSKAAAGDVFYVYNAALGRVSHVGVVEKVLSGGRIQTLEGNTDPGGGREGTGVFRLTRTVTSRLRFFRPNYALAVKAAPKPPAKPPVKPPAKPVPAKPVPAKPVPAENIDRRIYLDELVYAATHANLSGLKRKNAVDRIALTKRSLQALGCGKTSEAFNTMWRRFQAKAFPQVNKPAWHGKDADGVPGDESAWYLSRLTGRAYTRKK
jgi:hypothetical protein